jgi:hypothetical protein
MAHPFRIRGGTTDYETTSNEKGHFRYKLGRGNSWSNPVLIADQFIPDPDRPPEIDDVSGARDDSHIGNLRRVSKSLNRGSHKTARGSVWNG